MAEEVDFAKQKTEDWKKTILFTALLLLLNKLKIKTVDFRNNKQTIIYSTKRKVDFETHGGVEKKGIKR